MVNKKNKAKKINKLKYTIKIKKGKIWKQVIIIY